MSGVVKFEDLVAWQKAREMTREIYLITRAGAISKDYSLVDQMRRAATSIMFNIAEGFERSGPSEFHQFLVVAKASCGEVRSQLYVALDVGYLNEKEFQRLREMAEKLGQIIGALRAAVQRRRDAKN
jgi:four helix bundle protein